MQTEARLDPLAFPSDTDFRLLLLIASVIGSTLFIYNWIYFDLPQSRSDLSAYQACAQVAQRGSPNDAVAASQLFEACRGPIERTKAVWMLGGVGLIFVLALAIYLAAPEVKRRRRRLVPLTAEDVPEVAAALDELRERAGLRSPPQFLWDPMNGSAVGLAFGRRGRYFVALTGGLVTRFYSDRPAFESVVLHELGHLKNGDVDKTYLAIGIWQAFVVAGLIPLAVTVMLAPSVGEAASDVWILGWRAVVVGAMVYLVRNAVLRAREVYADLRAEDLQGSPDALMRALGPGEPPVRGAAGWRALLLTHPAIAARRQALVDPHPLFSVHPMTAFAAGLAAGIAYPSIVVLILLVFTGIPSRIWYWTTGEVAALVGSVALGLLIAGVVGVGLWRAAFAARIDPRLRPHVLWSAGAAALGIGVGGWVAFDAGFPLFPHDVGSLILYFFVYAVLIAGLGAGFFLILFWFNTISMRSIRAWVPAQTPPGWWPGFIALAVVLVCWMGAVLQARDALQDVAASRLPPWTYPVVPLLVFVQAVPLGLIALATLSIYSVAAVPRGSREGPTLWHAVLFALLAALVYLLVVASLRRAVGSTAHLGDLQILMLFGVEIALAIGIQSRLAAIVANRYPAMAVTLAVASALAAGILMAPTAMWVNVLAGGTPDAGMLFILLAAMLLVGGGAAVAVAWISFPRSSATRASAAQRR